MGRDRGRDRIYVYLYSIPKTHLISEFLDACIAEGPQLVTRRGTEAAVLVPAA
jgi:hypothetical protein